MCRPIFVVLLVLTGCGLTMPPPAGLNLKPAKAVGEKQKNAPLLGTRSFFGAVTEAPITAKPPTRPNPRELPSSANYGVNSMLQTNFVDSHGRVLKNVVSIPIRVGNAQIKQVSTSVASAALVEGEAEKNVHVKFEPAPTTNA
uniref:Pilus assembly protein PilP n=1 Tax=Angiostrongylus cantonensis TaxID=6313 RepID=A0A0K0DCA0_ANGCA